ncbi:rhodanese-like domain-containing protein [Pseudoduganella aquatica]|uniref:Rhodanese-like domain-containing protein n=1 Tax=Pseudoduganella aquatica TaxID=2660641 RepID=A0A7X4HFJ0_9BURK|nr:rhodanese-like domain-containing protein [Pseudoduganella aquatica]MYN10274.1 rhodanese-like domain-containing protein [Pseudoduganella aquatica]
MKFLLDQIFLIGIVALSGGALLWPVLTQRGKKVSPAEAVQLINRAKTTILDVREAKEYAEGHLPDAKHIPAGELKQRMAELDKFKNRTVVVVCQKGARAFGAAKLLAGAGFENVVVLEGGQSAWQTAGLPLAK